MVVLTLTVILLILIVWFVTESQLRGSDLSHHDGPKIAPINGDTPPSSAHHDAVKKIQELFSGGGGMPSEGSQLEKARRAMDNMADSADLSDITIIPTTAEGVAAEWVLAPHSDPNRRLLYIHGGAFAAGSPRSHRAITTAFARRLGFSVLAIDYRLRPEHPIKACMEDCRRAYRWLFVNGPNCWHPVETLCVAGDSAGGNLTLTTAAWARDQGIRLPDAVVALSPTTDASFASPSMRDNIDTDPLLGPILRRVVTAPEMLLLWFGWLSLRMSPSSPQISPVYGELDGLPPTLIQASEAEMLRDDAYRYFYKAKAASSPVTLQTWEHMLHVWHMFEPTVPEAQQAFDHIESFLASVLPTQADLPQAVAAG